MQVIGEERTRAQFDAMAQKMESAASDAAFAAAQYASGQAKRSFRTVGSADPDSPTGYAALGQPVPERLTSRTGRLRASIDALQDGVGRALIGSPVVYAAIHEFGGKTSPHVIRPRKAKYLRFIGASGNPVYAKSVRHPGSNIPPRPYLRPAVMDNLAEIKALIVRVFRRKLGVQEG